MSTPPAEQAFRILGLCASAPGHTETAMRLQEAMRGFTAWNALLGDAEENGLEPLLHAHLVAAGIDVPPHATGRLRVRWMQHAHRQAVQMRSAGVVLDAFLGEGIPVVVLKGAALASLVYPDPLLRPMRDIDLLVRAVDLTRACEVLSWCGFAVAGPPLSPDHHHARAMLKITEGVTVTIELHHGLFQPTPFLRQMTYEDVAERTQPFQLDGRSTRALGAEDMLWHIYAHAFAINVTRPAIRLISVADLTILTERWIARIDWEAMSRRYRRALHALPFLEDLTPWPVEVRRRLIGLHQRPAANVRPVAARFGWSRAGLQVLWPTDWWLGVRYGIEGPLHALRCRAFTHPASVAICGLRRARRLIREKRITAATNM